MKNLFKKNIKNSYFQSNYSQISTNNGITRERRGAALDIRHAHSVDRIEKNEKELKKNI